MYRVSLNVLEKFLNMLNNEDGETEQTVVWAMTSRPQITTGDKINAAYKKLLLDSSLLMNGNEIDGIRFNYEQAAIAQDYARRHYHAIGNVPTTKRYIGRKFDMLVTGVVDSVEGFELHDINLCFNAPDVKKLINSFRWKLLLDMYYTDVFHYDQFELVGFDGFDKSGCVTGQIIEHEPFELINNKNVSNEIKLLLNDFEEWVSKRELFKHLKKVS